MDLIKIGKFISESRKKKNLTQMQLAEELNITDRAISKWECGRAIRRAIRGIRFAKVHATGDRPQRVDRAIALAIGKRARFPPREIIVERLVFGIIFG